ncbi:MAG: methyl-accepting chemotaxis protein [Chloroflexi bacterium]|nr:methyl-accepting chemotaxis protein [Chloroflexota bacterium]
MTKYPRKKFFLRESSQPRLLVGIELVFLILLVVSSLIFYILANRDLTATYLQAHLTIRNVQELLLPTLTLINLGGLALGAVLLIFYTHRIAGPAYRLARTLREIGQGKLPRAIHFRRGDELAELEAATNDMLTELSRRVFTLQAHAQGLNQEIAQLAANASASAAELAHLQETARRLDSELAGFHVPSGADTSQPPGSAAEIGKSELSA